MAFRKESQPSYAREVSRRDFLRSTSGTALTLAGAGVMLSCPAWLRELVSTAAASTETPGLVADAPLDLRKYDRRPVPVVPQRERGARR